MKRLRMYPYNLFLFLYEFETPSSLQVSVKCHQMVKIFRCARTFLIELMPRSVAVHAIFLRPTLSFDPLALTGLQTTNPLPGWSSSNLKSAPPPYPFCFPSPQFICSPNVIPETRAIYPPVGNTDVGLCCCWLAWPM